MGFADYLSTNPTWQVIVVPHATFTLEASKQPGSTMLMVFLGILTSSPHS